MIDRRRLIAGGALLAMGAAPDRDAAALASLDQAAALSPAERLKLLGRIDTASLTRGRRLDVLAAIRAADLEVRMTGAPKAKRYPLQLRQQAGFDITPDIAHRQAQQQADLFTRAADRMLRAEGLVGGSVAERLRRFARDERFLYPDDDSGRTFAVSEMNRWLVAARGRLRDQFASLSPAVFGARIVRMTSAEEAAGTAGYRSFDGLGDSGRGAYHVDLHDIARRPAWSLPSVVHHETLPGHMVQIALQARARPHPLRLKAAPGFFEGWAIYAEQLAADSGAFAGDRPAAIGYCQCMLFRLGRSLIDTGINHLGWSSGRAIDVLADLQGDPIIFAPFAKDAARADSDPGGFAGQAFNWLQMLAKRRSAASLSDGPALRRFHARLLDDGPLPLALL